MQWRKGYKWLALVLAAVVNGLIFLSIPLLNTVAEEPGRNVDISRPVSISVEPEEFREEEEQEVTDPEPELSREPEFTAHSTPLPEMTRKNPQPEVEPDIDTPSFEMPDTDVATVPVEAQQAAASEGLAEGPLGPEAHFLREVDSKPRVTHRVEPRYPQQARRQGTTGKVELRFLVNEEGEVEEVSVISSQPEGIFEDSAVNAVKRWSFEPGRVEGEPVPTWVRLPISFTLQD